MLQLYSEMKIVQIFPSTIVDMNHKFIYVLVVQMPSLTIFILSVWLIIITIILQYCKYCGNQFVYYNIRNKCMYICKNFS